MKWKIRKMKWKVGETNVECEERAEERSNTKAHDTWMRWRAQTLEPMSCETFINMRANTRKCDVWRCSVHTPRRLQQIAISCERSCYNKKIWAPPVFIPPPPWCTGRRRMSPLELVKKNWFRSFFSRFSVETVHSCDCCSEVWSEFHWCIFCLICSVRWTSFSYISQTRQRMGSRSGLPVPIYPLRCTSPRSSQFWVADHDILNPVGNCREFLLNPFWYISSAHYGLWSAPSVHQFHRVKHHEVATFWWRCAGLRKHPVAIGENYDWIRFQPRGVHKCNRLLHDSNQEGILSIALLELFRTTRITLHCPCHESSLSIFHWMGCRRYFVAIRLEVLLDEDDSRSSSRVFEHGHFL